MEKIGEFLVKILDWSEVWAMLVPLSVLLFYRQQLPSLRPVIAFVWLAFLVNVLIDAIMGINMYFKEQRLSNNPLYNLQSFIRLICFSVYFIHLRKDKFSRLRIILLVITAILILVNFIFFDNLFTFDTFSSNLFTCESLLLLIYCMFYYLTELEDDRNRLRGNPHFWVVTGLSIYVVVNFFIFLFYPAILGAGGNLATNIWNVHNISFVVLCLFLTKAFYDAARYQYSV